MLCQGVTRCVSAIKRAYLVSVLSLIVSFPSQVINEKIHINFRFFLFFLYSSHVLPKCFSIFENSSEKIGFLGLIYFFILFIRHNWTSRRNNNNYNTSKCARGYEQQYLFVQKLVFSKTQHFLLQNSTSVYVVHARNR